jgi:NADH-quinone oxidoreductase subunit J
MTVFNTKNPVYGVLALIGVVMHVVVLLILLEQEFLAYTLAIVYIGAIVVLFLFVIMMFYLRRVTGRTSVLKYVIEYWLLGMVVAMFYEAYSFFSCHEYVDFSSNSSITEFTSIIAQYLFNDLAIFSILAAVVMLVGIMGSILLTIKSSGVTDQKIIRIRADVLDSINKIR